MLHIQLLQSILKEEQHEKHSCIQSGRENSNFTVNIGIIVGWSPTSTDVLVFPRDLSWGHCYLHCTLMTFQTMFKLIWASLWMIQRSIQLSNHLKIPICYRLTLRIFRFGVTYNCWGWTYRNVKWCTAGILMLWLNTFCYESGEYIELTKVDHEQDLGVWISSDVKPSLHAQRL